MRLRRVLSACVVLALMLTGAATGAGTTAEQAAVMGQVETSLLSLLGLSRRPSRRHVDRARAHVPAAVLDMYRRQTSDHVTLLGTANFAKPGLHAGNANTVRSFTHTESRVDKRFPGHHKFRLFFNVSSIPGSEVLRAAEVTLSREAVSWPSVSEGSRHHLQQVLVHDIVRAGVRGSQEARLRLVDSRLVDTRHDGSLALDVLPAVQRWREEPKHNHGLLVHVVPVERDKDNEVVKHLRLRRSANEVNSDWNARQPLLLTYTDDGRNRARTTADDLVQRRARRASAKHKGHRKEKDICRRHPLYVDFTDVGWNDWIVAPPGYEAFYCSGDCPFPLADHLNTTNHAIVQTLMNSAYPSSVPKACCVPTALAAISMLYLDEENKVVLKNYQDMAVLGCGCR